MGECNERYWCCVSHSLPLPFHNLGQNKLKLNVICLVKKDRLTGIPSPNPPVTSNYPQTDVDS